MPAVPAKRRSSRRSTGSGRRLQSTWSPAGSSWSHANPPLAAATCMRAAGWRSSSIWSASAPGAHVGLLFPKVEYLPTATATWPSASCCRRRATTSTSSSRWASANREGHAPYWDVDPVTTPEAAELDFGPSSSTSSSSRADARCSWACARSTRCGPAELVPLIQRIGFTESPAPSRSANQTSLFEQGISAGRTIDIEITGPDLPSTSSDSAADLRHGDVQLVPGAQSDPQPEPRPVESGGARQAAVGAKRPRTSADRRRRRTRLHREQPRGRRYAGDYYDRRRQDRPDRSWAGAEFAGARAGSRGPADRDAGAATLVPLRAVSTVELGSGPEQINRRERAACDHDLR